MWVTVILTDLGKWWELFFVCQALNAEEQRLKEAAEMMKMNERKRPYNSLKEVREPTEEEMEAFRMKRARPDDPMASFLNQWSRIILEISNAFWLHVLCGLTDQQFSNFTYQTGIA